MALVLKDRVRESSTSSGTGSIALAGAFPGYQSFSSAIASGSTVYYTIHNTTAGNDGEWEVGVGTFTSPTTLSRDTVLSSSAGAPTKTNFTGSSVLDVFITQPAEEAIYINQATGKVEASGNGTSSISFSNVTADLFTGNLTGTATTATTADQVANALTAGTGISFSTGTTYNGSTAITINSAVTSPIPTGSVMLFYQSAAPTGWTQSTALEDYALRITSGTGGSTGGTTAFSTVFTNQTPTGTVSTTVDNTTATMASYTPEGSISVTVGAGTLAVGAGTFAVGSTTAGGSVSLSGGGSVSATTLSTAQMPSHNHTGTIRNNEFEGFGAAGQYTVTSATTTGSAGSSSSHTHGFTNPSYSFSGTSHTHSLTGAPTISGSPSVTAQSFTGTAATLTQNAHNHTASSSFSGSALTLNVQYANIIICTKD